MLPQHPVLLQCTRLQHPLSSKDNASTKAVLFWRRVSTLQQQQPSSPVRHRHTRRLTSLQLWVRRCPLSRPTSRSCTGGSVRGTNQGQNVIVLPVSPRRQEVSSVHPQRCQGFDPTFAQGIILRRLYYTPEVICQKCIVRTYQVRVAVFGG